MSEGKQQQFQIHLPGLLKLLAESLYSSKAVAIRELIQNAHDSCVRRRVEYKEAHYKPSIHISTNMAQRTVTIRDNGSGLLENEITEYLATIGRSYTRQLGENLTILSPEEAEQLIGQFGLGFLSAFLIAREITLVTRSAKPDSPTLQWSSTGDMHYEVKEIEERDIGTSVTLSLKAEASIFLHEPKLREAIFAYADFLNVPIYLGNGQSPVNTMAPPWESHDSGNAILEYIKRQYHGTAPLAIIPLDDATIDLGHDSVRVPMQGFLFIPPGSIASTQEYGDVTVYIRRMFISGQQRELLPKWAKFVRGVVDCAYLQPTASREDIQQDQNFFHVEQALQQQLVEGLKQIARRQPDIWRLIVNGHRDVILGWAVKDKEFFDEVASIITFRTSHGDMSLPEYTKATDNTIYYSTRSMGSLQEKLLGEGYGVMVIDASRFSEPRFLKLYAEKHPYVQLLQLDDDSYQLLHPVENKDYDPILTYYQERGIQARLSNFQPPDVPAVLIYPPNAEFFNNARKAIDKGRLPRPFAGLVGGYMSNMDIDEDAMRGTLHLNTNNPLVQQLPSIQEELSQQASLDLIYHIARLFAGRMLETADVSSSFGQATNAIQRLLGTDNDGT